jgi:phosphohistidine phosphatase
VYDIPPSTRSNALRIYLVRHGDADAEVPEGLGDEGRALTAKARGNLMAHFAALAPRMEGISLVLTSPLVRAVQTASLLSVSLRHEGLLRAHRSLLPDMPVGALDSLIRDHSGENLVLVGHNPTMGAMAAHLLALPTLPKPVNPGTVIGLERSDEGVGAATLMFYAPPGQPVLDHLT